MRRATWITWLFFSFWVKITFEILLPCCLASRICARPQLYRWRCCHHRAVLLSQSVSITESYATNTCVHDAPIRTRIGQLVMVICCCCCFNPIRLSRLFCFGKSVVCWPDPNKLCCGRWIKTYICSGFGCDRCTKPVTLNACIMLSN